MNENFSEELINELSRDMCFRKEHCTVESCYKVNCETTWLATSILRQGWVKQKECTRRLNLGLRSYCSNCGELTTIHRYCASCGAKVKE